MTGNINCINRFSGQKARPANLFLIKIAYISVCFIYHAKV
jgi:hypothetical protein